MTYSELSDISGKKVGALKQLFYRKRWSMRSSEDVQRALYWLTRTRMVRRKPVVRRSAEHLAVYRFGSPLIQEEARRYFAAHARVVGMAREEAPLGALGKLWATGTVGMIAALTGKRRYTVTVVQASAVRRAAREEQMKLLAGHLFEEEGIALEIRMVTVSDLFAWGHTDPAFFENPLPRVEMGIVTCRG